MAKSFRNSFWYSMMAQGRGGGSGDGGEGRSRRCVCILIFVVPLHAARRTMAAAGFLYITLSEMIGPNRAPLSPCPHCPPNKGKQTNEATKEKSCHAYCPPHTPPPGVSFWC